MGAAALLLLLVGGRARADALWKAWGDGKAEHDGYTLIEPRYGQARTGTAVMIFVTEGFSESDEGNESYLRQLGLPGPRPAPTPRLR